MPVIFRNVHTLSTADGERLWQETIAYTKHADVEVTVNNVSEEEIRRLNRTYRDKDTSTNVLTFSYPPEHDVAFCWTVVEREAKERGSSVRDHAALVLVHAFLHVVGMDHERSEEEAHTTAEAEQNILEKAGFLATHL